MKKLLILLLFAPLFLQAQIVGIKWTTGFSWEQVKQKAAAENKYIFLDCFTTWCGPCKMMDEYVYSKDAIGNYFNDKFISVRVQMDVAKNDDAFIKSWYNDAKEISDRYLIEGYPSFLFFSSNGVFVHKDMGVKDADGFILVGQTALTPGKTFEDVYDKYQRLLAEFKNGGIKFDSLPFMVTIAKKLGDSTSSELLRVHANHVSTLRKTKRYTKRNIEFWSTLNLSLKSDLLQFFYRDGKFIDKVMGRKGYAAKQVDKCIQNFTVMPFIDEQLNDPEAKVGFATFNSTTGTQVLGAANNDEANWKKLEDLIDKDFNSATTLRNMLKAKAVWYEKNRNIAEYAKASFRGFQLLPPDVDDWWEFYNINHVCWKVFTQLKDEELINEAITWVGQLVTTSNFISTHSDPVDTYANLLYKVGRVKEAIKWEEKALEINPNEKFYKKALEHMKKGEPTYEVQPLITTR
ncbi:MAG: thioredoxin family protein [Chitinophagaceae bacterium]